ncbi:MAG TPA: hypothetical protein VFV93_04810 [Thermomicrobiales bacterium]|nr:hypothetical protein [Thermomicrobiales bacterium]
MIDRDELQRDPYDHDYQNVDEETIPDRRDMIRIVFWIVSALIAIGMVAWPVIRVIDWGDDDSDGPSAASQARAFVAERFASDALVRFSASDAARWAVPSVRRDIDAIVDDLRQRPATDFQGAAVTVARVSCPDQTEPDSECFHAWIRQPGAKDLLRLLLVVSIVNGDARVTEIERINVV